jgi:HAD superfamily hydrolase (TIGR01484 family)
MKESYKAFAFDLDGTLAVSKSALSEKMSNFLCKMLSQDKIVMVISGGWMPQFEKQFLANFNCTKDNLKRLYLMPTSGAVMYFYKDGSWQKKYERVIPVEDVSKIENAFKSILSKLSFTMPKEKLWGEQLENRITQISYSALGQEAPIEEKEKWDSDDSKKAEMVELLQPMLPDYDVKAGGTTTIDVTVKGVDKGYGMEQFVKEVGLNIEEVLFTGDRIYPGGNDHTVVRTGVDTCSVNGPEEVMKKLNKFLN